jgi:hypothetical protein
MKAKKVRTHLITDGNSLFGANEVACKRPLFELPGEEGVFGWDDTIKRVTCRRCQASKEYREMCKEMEIPHPFSMSAYKAHATMERKRKAREVGK